MRVYRGVKLQREKYGNSLGIWVTDDKDFAKEYGKIFIFIMSNNINLFDVNTYEGQNITDIYGDDIWYQPNQKIINRLKKLGYDGFWNDKNIFIWNKKMLTEQKLVLSS